MRFMKFDKDASSRNTHKGKNARMARDVYVVYRISRILLAGTELPDLHPQNAREKAALSRFKKREIIRGTNIPVCKQYTLTIEEAAWYFNIGKSKLRKLINKNKNAKWILWNDNRPQIKRRLFEEYIDKCHRIL